MILRLKLETQECKAFRQRAILAEMEETLRCRRTSAGAEAEAAGNSFVARLESVIGPFGQSDLTQRNLGASPILVSSSNEPEVHCMTFISEGLFKIKC